MTASWRFSTLGDRHRALGSDLEDWSGMGTAWSYDKDQQEEYLAIRTKAGVMDVSGLKKVHITGAHASHVIDRATTARCGKDLPGASFLRLHAERCRQVHRRLRDLPYRCKLVHGRSWFRDGHEQLTRAAVGRDVSVRFDDNLHDISLQGPVAVDFLEKHVEGIRHLNYFAHMPTRLFGHPVTISRTGYTGERGYEIFCRGQDAPHIWDTIVAEGADMGIIPTRFTTLDLLRTESYLLFYPYDNSQMYPFDNDVTGDTLWELGLDFTVSEGKTGFRGAEEHYRLKGRERFKIFGLKLEGKEPADEGAPLLQDGKQIGVATIGMYSSLNEHNVAIARMPVECAKAGTKLQVKNSSGLIDCEAAPMPFYDIDKARRTAKG